MYERCIHLQCHLFFGCRHDRNYIIGKSKYGRCIHCYSAFCTSVVVMTEITVLEASMYCKCSHCYSAVCIYVVAMIEIIVLALVQTPIQCFLYFSFIVMPETTVLEASMYGW